MGFTNAGLNNKGVTQFFNFSYDDTLSSARGVDLTNDLMNFCDKDFSLVASWFTGVSVGTPIIVNVANLSGGAGWSGWGLIPIVITLKLGEDPVVNTTPTTLLRYLLVSEISEIFMRDRQPLFFNRFNDWFEAFDEGSKGEALSRFLGMQFLINEFGSLAVTPASYTDSYGVSSLWLNPPPPPFPPVLTRADFINTHPDDNKPDAVTGCATLFLFYLHDQLGFSISDIINHGGDTLAKVYRNLTGLVDAWIPFITLVNLHYPADGTLYFPLDDNIFPVSNLVLFTAPKEVSWVTNGNFNNIGLVVDHPAKVDIKITLASDDINVIAIQKSAVIQSKSNNTYIGLNVLPQPGSFQPKVVTITASYAGKTLTNAIKVVPPEALVLPPLQIVPKRSANPCEQLFVEGTSQDFGIQNLSVISNHQGLVYDWSVNGAVIQANNTEVLSIPSLPPAGTKVTITVTVNNASKIHASGTYEFTTTQKATGLAELEREITCYIKNIKNVVVSIPPWVPIERNDGELNKEQITRIENQSRQVILTAEKVIASINKIRSSMRNI